MKRTFLVLISIIMLSVSCTTTKKPSPTDPISGEIKPPLPYPFDWDYKAEAKYWEEYAIDALLKHGDNLLEVTPLDAETYCPNFRNLNKKEKVAFYVQLLASMARYESSHTEKPRPYLERFRDRNGNKVSSRGLLMISTESSSQCRYDCKPCKPGAGPIDLAIELVTPQELETAQFNIECSVKILNFLVGDDVVIGFRDGTRWRGGARYWSVLRKTHNKYKRILEKTRNFPVCKK